MVVEHCVDAHTLCAEQVSSHFPCQLYPELATVGQIWTGGQQEVGCSVQLTFWDCSDHRLG